MPDFFLLNHLRKARKRFSHSIFSSQAIILFWNFLPKRRFVFMFFGVYGGPPFLCLLQQLNKVTKKNSNFLCRSEPAEVFFSP